LKLRIPRIEWYGVINYKDFRLTGVLQSLDVNVRYVRALNLRLKMVLGLN